MHPHKLIHGRSRCRWKQQPVLAIHTAAILIPRRSFVSAVSHTDAHLEKTVTLPTHLFNLNIGSRWGVRSTGLDAHQSKEVDRRCMLIRDVGERIIVPLLRSVEAEEAGRQLVDFDKRFKDTHRVKEKLVDRLRRAPGRTPIEGLVAIPDVVRFTLQYLENEYAQGVRRDMARFWGRGCVLGALRNTWVSDQYKGINARWREPTSGVMFEVQFHTQASLRAREVTHAAYERMRGAAVEGTEMAMLRAFQRRVNAVVSIPPAAMDIGEGWLHGGIIGLGGE